MPPHKVLPHTVLMSFSSSCYRVGAAQPPHFILPQITTGPWRVSCKDCSPVRPCKERLQCMSPGMVGALHVALQLRRPASWTSPQTYCFDGLRRSQGCRLTAWACTRWQCPGIQDLDGFRISMEYAGTSGRGSGNLDLGSTVWLKC